MLYLGIMVAVAALGLLRLWLIQRKERRADWRDIDKIKVSLERLSTQPAQVDARAIRERRRPAEARGRSSDRGALTPLDPARREAARRRIQARRAARARATG